MSSDAAALAAAAKYLPPPPAIRSSDAPSGASALTAPSSSAASAPGLTLKVRSEGEGGVVGHGSFGVVFEATVQETGERVAVKKVLQDRRFRNRELTVMKQLHHPNIVALRHFFYVSGEKEEEVYLNLVLEYVPDTVYKVCKTHASQRRELPPLVIKLYVYQMCRSLAYLHALGICHRDIKPQNLLVDAATHVLKLCDFGSSKALVAGEASVAYICSRYYRAPELIFGAQDYTIAIDVWSMGCVFAELVMCRPLFPGETGIDQLVEIIKVLGTPTREQVLAMNKSYTEFNFPQVQAQSWDKLFKSRASSSAIDLCSAMLTYEPRKRITASAALLHPFFDELRAPGTRLPDGSALPPLFNFVEEELRCFSAAQRDVLIPSHARLTTAAAPAALAAGAGVSAPQTARSDTTMLSLASSAGAGAGSSAADAGTSARTSVSAAAAPATAR